MCGAWRRRTGQEESWIPRHILLQLHRIWNFSSKPSEEKQRVLADEAELRGCTSKNVERWSCSEWYTPIHWERCQRHAFGRCEKCWRWHLPSLHPAVLWRLAMVDQGRSLGAFLLERWKVSQKGGRKPQRCLSPLCCWADWCALGRLPWAATTSLVSYHA